MVVWLGTGGVEVCGLSERGVVVVVVWQGELGEVECQSWLGYCRACLGLFVGGLLGWLVFGCWVR